MTLRIYDDTTHQAVPKKHARGENVLAGLTPEMCAAFWAAHAEALGKHGHFEATNAGYNAMLAAAPPHGVELPTREEIADAIYRVTINKASVGRITAHVVMTLEAADAVLALIQHKVGETQ